MIPTARMLKVMLVMLMDNCQTRVRAYWWISRRLGVRDQLLRSRRDTSTSHFSPIRYTHTACSSMLSLACSDHLKRKDSR